MKNIQVNSKLVKNGDVFVGIPCKNLSANIREAYANGASVVFAETRCYENVIVVDDARMMASILAKLRYNEQPKYCSAITGTNGKSSTAHFLRQIWTYSGLRAANLGTLGLFVDGVHTQPNGIDVPNLTTPDPITLHKILKYLNDESSVTHLAFEASSHALDQKRLHSVELESAAFTNFASDHLDYHETKSAYLKSKMQLFEKILPKDRPAIVSRDFPDLFEMVSHVNNNLVTFGLKYSNLIRASNVEETSQKITFDFICGDQEFKQVEANLFGSFQVMNLLCAAAMAFASGISPAQIAKCIPNISTLEGRMEHVASYNGGNIYVDFAHTSEGLKSALGCFKKTCAGGRLICVFGCGGNRDKSKRSEMGEIAASLADVVIVTDDNPRDENPSDIRNEIMRGCPGAVEIADRAEAIRYGMKILSIGDSLVLMGKGHETVSLYHDRKVDGSDKDIVMKVISDS